MENSGLVHSGMLYRLIHCSLLHSVSLVIAAVSCSSHCHCVVSTTVTQHQRSSPARFDRGSRARSTVRLSHSPKRERSNQSVIISQAVLSNPGLSIYSSRWHWIRQSRV
ncbi:uncharacterized protein HD556DRAFT_1382937 [Suillus plorans]|uniref:Secreted protein n=1 Tax=Suillus plorans TaxID=116603 RepID=A0A9P7ALD1_9AGAM|nr:uncharacterized protein HD556DRAFT_1382937 [Suillus plorans]KAG1791835.1 hypothetical protein HD556DRAFT_1382937 [Suillus plorans]